MRQPLTLSEGHADATMGMTSDKAAVTMSFFMHRPEWEFMYRDLPQRLLAAYNFRLRLDRKTIPMLGTTLWRVVVWATGMLAA